MSVQKEYYDEDEKVLKSEVFIVNNNMEGEYKSYYESSSIDDLQLELICNYVDGVKNGEQIEYYDNNQIKTISNYKDDKLNGKVVNYYQNGILESEEYYEDNCLHGECKYYNENGLLDEVINYEFDSMDGKYYKYNNGVLETECEYYRDEYMGESLVGDYINYYSQGEFNGSIKDICTYEDGQKNGEYKEYYIGNGKIKAKGNYKHNYKVGYEYRYDIEGNLIQKVLVDERDKDDWTDNDDNDNNE